jgi:hypothetical protein
MYHQIEREKELKHRARGGRGEYRSSSGIVTQYDEIGIARLKMKEYIENQRKKWHIQYRNAFNVRSTTPSSAAIRATHTRAADEKYEAVIEREENERDKLREITQRHAEGGEWP